MSKITRLSVLVMVILLAAAMILASCSPGTPSSSSTPATSSTLAASSGLKSISPSPSATQIGTKAKPVQLDVTALYNSGPNKTVTDKCTFKSSDDKVATVSAGGLITPVSDGKCTIDVSYTEEGVTQTKSVDVTVFSGYVSPIG